MPLTKMELSDTGGWALWHVTEQLTDLEKMVGIDHTNANIAEGVKKLEWLASRMLARRLAVELNIDFTQISKDQFSKPYIEHSNAQLSISHSYPFVAVQFSFVHAVGIDIEKPSVKISKVAYRVFSKSELLDAGDNLEKNCVYWCAKEALYKIYGKRGLSYADNLLVEPFEIQRAGELRASVSTAQLKLAVILNYHILSDIVVVYTKQVYQL